MRRNTLLLIVAIVLLIFGVALARYLHSSSAVLIGVMVDNHEDARPYQRGLDHAIFVEEQLVEGYITRFMAVFDLRDLPASVGPVRSVRPYFIDGSSPVITALYHAGGSPEALEKLAAHNYPVSFNALRMGNTFSFDPIAPAPHHRFISAENIRMLFSQVAKPKLATLPLFPLGSPAPDAAAPVIKIDFHSIRHNVTYTYDSLAASYAKESDGIAREPSPQNVIVIETLVEDTGVLGRLHVDMDGGGKALLFRDGGVQKGRWSKSGPNAFFTFTGDNGKTMEFHDGQVWMIVLDSLQRVSWE